MSIENLVAQRRPRTNCPAPKRRSFFGAGQGISTSVEMPLQINPFYAKQTQFPKKSNDVSFFYTMEQWIMKIKAIGQLVKTNPIQTQSKPIAERVKLMQSVYLQRITEKKMILQSE